MRKPKSKVTITPLNPTAYDGGTRFLFKVLHNKKRYQKTVKFDTGMPAAREFAQLFLNQVKRVNPILELNHNN